MKENNIEMLKNMNLPGHELTFSNDFKKVKLTVWENGQPVLQGKDIHDVIKEIYGIWD